MVAALLVVVMLAPATAFGQAPAPAPAPAPIITPPTIVPPAPPPATSAPTSAPRLDITTPPGVPAQRFVVPPDYVLGPGDGVEIQIAGRTDVQRFPAIVDIDGNVSLPPLGNIQIGGLTVLQATRKVQERARDFFKFADVVVAVTQPRVFEVAVTGEVQRPATVQISSARRLQDAVLGAGGPTPRGSIRRVQVTTKDGTLREYDLLRFELGGDATQNPLVLEGMRIHVPVRAATVTLTGAVGRPGEYELQSGGSLSELLALVGGVSPTGAPAEARLTRFGPDGRRETLTVDLRTALARPADVHLKAGDALFVPNVGRIQDIVDVRGAFVGTDASTKSAVAGKQVIAQRLELAQGDRVRDVVGRVGGASTLGDLRLAFVDRTPSAGPPQRIPVDLHKLYVDKDETQNIALENGDVVTLPVLEDKIYLNGEVRATTPVDFRPEFTARDYIAAAGGFNIRAKPEEAFVTFRNGRSYLLTEAPALEPGAVITVPEVSVRWYQDYLAIANAIVGFISAYAGLFILFGGTTGGVFGGATTIGR
ncbi:MAG TPA: SLBB domain-containing protein [Terriglobales bacterium]|nr:SLBB domain-containing protein [Terriglobales bacterium]